MRFNKTALLGAVFCAGSLHSPAAWAQDASASTATGDEIVVSARKREESVLNVPVITSTLSEERLQTFQVQDLKGIATMVPGLTLGDSVLAVGTQVSLRGVGTSALDPGVDASVSLVVDGLQLSQGLAYASGMFDVARVEVLKGPQSLFYGKSSPGGVIAVRTADPTNEFELIARAGYEFEANERRAELIVSGPVTDALKLRLAGFYTKQDGFFRNIAIGDPAFGGKTPAYKRISPSESYMLRGTVLFEPSKDFDARLKVNYVKDDVLYSGTKQQTLCLEGLGPVNGIQFVAPNDGCKRDRNVTLVDLDPAAFPGVPRNGTPFVETEQVYGSLELNYRPTETLTVTSATAYYQVNTDTLLNAGMSGRAGSLVAVVNDFHRDQFTQELRLASDGDGPLNFTAGGYLERGEFSNLQTAIGNAKLGLPARTQFGRKEVKVRTNSLFGQLLYKAVPELEIAAGVRWTDEKRTIRGTNFITGTPQAITFAVPKLSANNFAPELTLTYSATDDLTIFGALKQGYKSGSFNVATAPFNGENNAFGDEKVQGGEVGLKSRLADRSVSFNAAAYYYRYSGLQVGANVPTPGGISATRTINAGKAEIYGIEADLSYRPRSVDGLHLFAAANWNHARYIELNNVPCFGGQTEAQGCNQVFSTAQNSGRGGFTAQSRSGVPLFRAPDWTVNFGFDWELPVSDKLRVVLASNNQYSSKYVTNLGFLYYQPSFIKADASVTLKDDRNRWELALIGKNLGNKITSGNCSNSNNAGGLFATTQTTGNDSLPRGAAGVDEIGCFMDRGREIWLRVTLRPFN